MKGEIFSKEFTQALKIVGIMSGQKELVSVGKMMELGVSRSYAIRVLEAMVERKLVTAKEGRNGGYKLNVGGSTALRWLYGEDIWLKALSILKEPAL